MFKCGQGIASGVLAHSNGSAPCAQVRDEILNIMHRNNIKEQNGTWMEQWHQKLHNNTTPDDIGICEAYIAFLEASGDNGVYWRVLSDHGAPACAACVYHSREVPS